MKCEYKLLVSKILLTVYTRTSNCKDLYKNLGLYCFIDKLYFYVFFFNIHRVYISKYKATYARFFFNFYFILAQELLKT